MALETKKKVVFLIIAFIQVCFCQKQPHIIFILADDLGWNDVGFHGLNNIPTPNIDALAYSGLILNKYYVTAICTPSRSALMTGKLPIHNGMQHTVLFGAEPRGLPLTEKLLPQYLKDLGYTTRIVGKWHLGSYRREFTPLFRGFDSHLGFWTGHQDMNDHTAVEQGYWGLDMRRGLDPAWDLHGQYSTEVFTKESVKLIKSHNASNPLFLYLAHAAVHSGNPYNPLPASEDIVAKFDYIKEHERRRFAAMLTGLDESVGQVVQALSQNGMLQDSIIIFSTDNGGPAEGFNINAASNWPLRGVKNTLWEGGVRGAGLIWSQKFTTPHQIFNQYFHISDWLPTLYSAAGGDSRNISGIDGYDSWNSLVNNMPTRRTEILHNIDDIYGNAALTVGKWKYVTGSTYEGSWDGWYGPSGREGDYDINAVLNSPVARAMSLIKKFVAPEMIWSIRNDSSIQCNQLSSDCKPLLSACLFNIEEDQCETNNLAESEPEILNHMKLILDEYNKTAVPPGNKPSDPRGNPIFWDHKWTNFGDYI